MMKTPRRSVNPKDAEEALFKSTKKAATPAPSMPVIPNNREMVSIRLNSEVLAFFQEDGPGWQDRINDALVEFVKKSR